MYLRVEQAGSRRGLAGQSWGLLIYTFHKIIHVQEIPLPIWLVRTRMGGVFMELESSQKHSNGWTIGWPHFHICKYLDLHWQGIVWFQQKKKRTGKLYSVWAKVVVEKKEKDFTHTGLQSLLQNIWTEGLPLSAANPFKIVFHDSDWAATLLCLRRMRRISITPKH